MKNKTLQMRSTETEVEVYELLKPENTLPPATTDILAKFTEDAVAVLEKSLETAGKQASRSLVAMRNQYLQDKEIK